MKNTAKQGFTLIEMAIVLVIIGLIVGGILVGQSLIAAAGVRATITQIEKYNTAVNSFYGKYGYLPGDFPNPPASSFGFKTRGPFPGEGDGNGVIQGWNGTTATPLVQTLGEPGLFWVDLSTARLVDGGFSTAAYVGSGATCPCTGAMYDMFFPRAELGGNSIYVWSGGWQGNNGSSGDSLNYFGMSVITNLVFATDPATSPGLTVAQAQSMDAKADDGLPQSGRVTAQYINFGAPFTTANAHWSSGTPGVDGANSGTPNYGPTTAATAGSATTCYDNGGNASNPMQYSMTQSGGAGVNCALSFRFQ